MPSTHITPDTTVGDIVAADPATIKVFQQHQIDFCCGGKVSLAEACARQALDVDSVVATLEAAAPAPDDPADWRQAPLTDLVAHIQARYHVPLRAELPRLSAMMTKVVGKHGPRLPETLLPLQATFERLQRELLDHMSREDVVLFPAVVDLETKRGQAGGAGRAWIEDPIDVMEADHDAAGEALKTMRELTGGYAPPEGACATFRGLYDGLADLEKTMHVHVYLENTILFPRAVRLAREV